MSGAEGFMGGVNYAPTTELHRKETALADVTVERRRSRSKVLKRLGALATVAALAHGVHAYADDINEEKERLAHTFAYVSEYSATPSSSPQPLTIPHGVYETMSPVERSFADNIELASHTAIVDMSGFGKRQNDNSGDFMNGLHSLGAGWTLHYDPTGIDFDGITKMLIEKAHDDPRGINRLAFYGDSMGTIVATKIAADVARLAPNLSIPFVILDSPAVCLDVLSEQSKNDGYAMLNSMHIPGAEYSRIMRFVGEMYLQRKQIADNPSSFNDVYSTVHHEIFENAHLSANILLEEQFQIIINSDVAGDLKYLGSLEQNRRPVIFMTGAAQPQLDDVVNTPKSYELLKQWTADAGLQFRRLHGIEDFKHGNQAHDAGSRKEYRAIFEDEVVPVIRAAGDGAQEVN